VSWVEVRRGGSVESRHAVHVAVWSADDRLDAWVGDPETETFYRSAAKPLQALPLVEEGVTESLGLSDAELALCCASHEGEPEHVEGARSILRKAGADESLLRCGPHEPFSARAARDLRATGVEPAPIHNNCSGKHAGMIALALACGWDPTDYHRADHPVQERMRAEVARWSGVPACDIREGIDGCGVPCFAVPLRAIAASFGRFAQEADRGGAPGPVVRAMTGHPFMVGGTGRTCSEVMEVAGDRVFVKLGAEGVYAGGVRGQGVGFAIKVADGGRRAVEPALIRLLRELRAIDDSEVERLRAHGAPTLRNTRGDEVGTVEAAFSLTRAASGVR
jgi:L-asparaginase II